MEKIKINIQIMTASHSSWDKVPATEHEVENVHDATQTLADATGCPVRFTYPMAGITDVSRLNGGYARPAYNRKHVNHFFLSLKAINVVSQIANDFPELETDEPIEGTEAVDRLCRIWPEVKYIVDSNKKS